MLFSRNHASGAEVVRRRAVCFGEAETIRPEFRGNMGFRPAVRLRVVNAARRLDRPELFSALQSVPQGRRAGRENPEEKLLKGS